MALTKTVKKMFPTENTVGMHLTVKDDDRPDLGEGPQVVIDSDFAVQFSRTAGIVDDTKTQICLRMQEAINRYKSLKNIFGKSAYDAARDQIDNNLNL